MEMTELDEYQEWAITLAQYRPEDKTAQLLWMMSEFTSEVGELAEIFAKNTRKYGKIDLASDEVYNPIKGELGDCLFWIASIAQASGISLDHVIMENIDKLNKRADAFTQSS